MFNAPFQIVNVGPHHKHGAYRFNHMLGLESLNDMT